MEMQGMVQLVCATLLANSCALFRLLALGDSVQLWQPFAVCSGILCTSPHPAATPNSLWGAWAPLATACCATRAAFPLALQGYVDVLQD